MFVVQPPGQRESRGGLIVQYPSNTFGHIRLDVMSALPGEGGEAAQSPSVLLMSLALVQTANPVEKK